MEQRDEAVLESPDQSGSPADERCQYPSPEKHMNSKRTKENASNEDLMSEMHGSPLPFRPRGNESNGSTGYTMSGSDARHVGDIVAGHDDIERSRPYTAITSGQQQQSPGRKHVVYDAAYAQSQPRPMHPHRTPVFPEQQSEPMRYASSSDQYGPHPDATQHPPTYVQYAPHPSEPMPPSGYHYPSHHPVPSGPLMAPVPSSDSTYSNYRYSVPYAPHHAAPSFESHASSTMSHPYVVGAPGPVVTYSYGHHPTVIAYPGYQQPPYPTWVASAPPQPVEYVKDIKPTDVLCGRGGATNSHSGNRDFRLEVKKHQDRYLRANKKDKPSVAEKIVQLIRKRGGRFLKRSSTTVNGNVLWVDVGDDRAREKTCQALREGAPELRRKRQGASTDDDSRKAMRKDTEDTSTCSSPDRDRLGDGGDSFHEADTREDSSGERKGRSSGADSRDDSEGHHGEIVIRPCARLLKHSTTTEITMEELTPHERELYLRDFIPPNPDIRKQPKRGREIIRIARRYEPVAEQEEYHHHHHDDDDDDDDSIGDDEPWVAEV